MQEAFTQEKYLPRARRVVSFKINHEGKSSSPLYDIYVFDACFVHGSEKSPEQYDDNDYIIDCVNLVANTILQEYKKNGQINMLDLGDEVCTLICKDLYEDFMYTLTHSFEKFLTVWKGGAEKKTMMPAFKVIIKHLKSYYDCFYNISGPLSVATDILEMQKDGEIKPEDINGFLPEDDEEETNLSNIQGRIFFYAGSEDKKFFKRVEKCIHSLCKENNTPELESSALTISKIFEQEYNRLMFFQKYPHIEELNLY